MRSAIAMMDRDQRTIIAWSTAEGALAHGRAGADDGRAATTDEPKAHERERRHEAGVREVAGAACRVCRRPRRARYYLA
jgi:hypothetical protein